MVMGREAGAEGTPSPDASEIVQRLDEVDALLPDLSVKDQITVLERLVDLVTAQTLNFMSGAAGHEHEETARELGTKLERGATRVASTRIHGNKT
jgi:hypothetical protein